MHQPFTPIIKRVRRPFRRRTKPGTAPGAVFPDPESPAPEIRVFDYGEDQFKELKSVSVDQVRDVVGLHAVTWVDVVGLGDAKVIKQIGELFHIHQLALEDIVNVHQRAKVEVYDGQLFIVARMMSLVEGENEEAPRELDAEQISLIVGENYVVTFQERRGDCLESVRERIRKARGNVRVRGADYLAYALLDAIIDGYFPVLEYFGVELDALEDRLERQPGRATIHRLHQLRSALMIVRRAAWRQRDAINTLLREDVPIITPETHIYLRDCYDHTVQIIDVSDTCRELCADLRDLHFSQINIRQNDVMKVLTIMASIFIPLSFIAGLYGMNFDPSASTWNMPELKSRFGYPAALIVMALTAGGMLLFFRRKGWIGERQK
ncbi:MAG: magnesium and cobalt transport protein CorA [Planctomycetota bacterium]|nr:MAG: magnesium and cobalt transport protein CorA [Planctomycetota bacterium]REK29019.1 MAG: magnesium and cobalt transport protein CorA [Planctomycetota bacterium]REK39551.1 MAG: magnesium and cobalt transport protein CorA [Planctomycetota bacterium]